jgi:signal transduction histidine kinase
LIGLRSRIEMFHSLKSLRWMLSKPGNLLAKVIDRPGRRILKYPLYALGIFSCALLAWSVWYLLQSADAGFLWDLSSGRVTQVFAGSPAQNLLRSGDIILSMDGSPVSEVYLLPQKGAGEALQLVFERDGRVSSAEIPINQPTPASLLNALAPVPIAAAFCILGLFLLVFLKLEINEAMFFLFIECLALILVLGNLTLYPLPWVITGYILLLYWVGPIAVFAHALFLEVQSGRGLKVLLLILFLLAIAGSLIQLASLASVNASRSLRYLWVAINVAILLAFLLRAALVATSRAVRRKIGVLALANLLAFSPLVVFSLLPNVLLGQAMLPYEVSLLFVVFIPLGYGFAAFRYQLLALERYVDRSATVLLLVAVSGTIYTVLYAFLARLLPASVSRLSMTEFTILLALSLSAYPLYRRLQILVHSLLYGGWYDYRSAVRRASHTIAPSDSLPELAGHLLAELRPMMRLEAARLAWNAALQPPLTGAEQPTGNGAGAEDPAWIQEDGSIARFFQAHPGPARSAGLRQALSGQSLSAAEASLLADRRIWAWFPLQGRRGLIGVLLLGAKRGAWDFSDEDLEILDVIVRQASMTFDNALLITELRQRELESAQLHHQAVWAGEIERKRLARELHDQVIQSLSGLNYQFAGLQRAAGQAEKELVREMRASLRGAVDTLRRVCADLRPPALDSLGLAAILQAQVRSANQAGRLRASLTLEGEATGDLSEEVTLCLYRVLQEALANAQKHAQAKNVQVRYHVDAGYATLSIRDDGRGFAVPQSLGELARRGHFGLVGIRERVESLHGRLEITSAPGEGCQVQVEIPLCAGGNRNNDAKVK